MEFPRKADDDSAIGYENTRARRAAASGVCSFIAGRRKGASLYDANNILAFQNSLTINVRIRINGDCLQLWIIS